MARKFWEKVNGSRIQFYDEPRDLLLVDVDARIAEIQVVLGLADSVKALLIQSFPGVQSEAEFDAIFEDELRELADQRDYYHGSNVTVQETIDVIDHRWMSPADMSLGAGTIVSVCGEEVGNEAIKAIDGAGGTNWQHDVDEVHVIVFDLGYKKRIDGIRIKNPGGPGNPLRLTGVDVDVANNFGGLDKPESRVGSGLAFEDPNSNDRNLTTRTGRFVRLTIAATAHASNHVTVREIEMRTRPRTFQL